MTARTDLDNAFSILDAGISAHVTALKSARDTAAAAQAVANDDSYLIGLTAKVLSFADALNGSNPVAPVVTPVVAPVAPPAIPAFLLPAASPLPPQAQQDAQVAQVLPVAPVAPAPTLAVQQSGPSVLETMEAAVRSMVSGANTPK